MRCIPIIKLPAAKAFIAKGGYNSNTFPVSIPEDEPIKHMYISYYVRITDLEECLEMLQMIRPQNAVVANKAFFIAALSTLCKCFNGNDKYTELNANGFKKYSKIAFTEYKRFLELRNTHFAHESSEMKVGFAFIDVTVDESEHVKLGSPTVIVDNASIDYLNETACLAWVVETAKEFAIREYDKMANALLDKYKDKTLDELKSYGQPKALIANSI